MNSNPIHIEAWHGASKKIDELVIGRLDWMVSGFAPGEYLFYGTVQDFIDRWNDKFMYIPNDDGRPTVYITEHKSFNQR